MPRPAPARPAPPRPGLEDLLGGRLLAWVGGAAVAVGVCFLLAIAVSRGWLGEVERTVLAGVASLALLAVGAWAQERRGRTDAARAATAAGIVGLFATAVVAGAVYELVPEVVALLASLAVGAVATALALRWEARGIAGLGLLGALLSPALVGAVPSGEAVVALLVASVAAAAVLVWKRWPWLASGAFVIATPQWVAYLLFENPPDPVTLAVLVAFGIVTAAAAIGFEIRAAARELPAGAMALLATNALVLGVIGGTTLGDGWLVALAAAHLLAGVAARRVPRVSDELALTAVTLGVVLADVAAARLLDGLPLIAGWAATGLLFAALARFAAPGRDQAVMTAGLGAHLLLALSHALIAAPPDTLSGGSRDVAGMVALTVVAASGLVSGRLAAEGHTLLRAVLDAVALAVLGYQTAIALDGVALTIALAAEATALVLVARRARSALAVPGGTSDEIVASRGDDVALGGALTFAGAGLLHALAVLAPPDALVGGLGAPAAAAAGLVAAAAAFAALGSVLPRHAAAARGAAAVILLYAASVELVTPFQPGAEAAGLPLAELDVRQQGQVLLSALWALAGVSVLIAGLVRDHTGLRRGALAVLAVTAGKVFLFDLASLTSLYRAGSFVALGLLLLAGAFAWQRIRPRPLPDLRTVPSGLR